MLKKRYLVAAVFAVAGFLGLSAPPAALAAGCGNVVVNESNGNVTIGNNAISRTFSTAAGKLKTVEINNKLASTTLVPGSGSEEFVIQSLAEATRLPRIKCKSGAKTLRLELPRSRASCSKLHQLRSFSGSSCPAADRSAARVRRGARKSVTDSHTCAARLPLP